MSAYFAANPRPYVVILPVCNEAEALPPVLAELQESIADLPVEIVAGLNGCTDHSAEILKAHGIHVAHASQAGYGHGCAAAIALAEKQGPTAYLFFAADGANDPQDLRHLITEHRAGADFVLGQRTCRLSNWRALGALQLLANTLLGLWVTILTKRPFADIGPLRLIDATLLRKLNLQERHYGWTIEAQVLACQSNARIKTLCVTERHRVAGQQKVSGVSLWHSLKVGTAIAKAGWDATKWNREVPHSCVNNRMPKEPATAASRRLIK